VPSELTIHAENHDGMVVTATDGRHTLTMDYPLPAGHGVEPAGLTPLRVLLASLAGCSCSTLAALLRKMRQPITSVTVDVHGSRRDEHPTVITHIDLTFTVWGDGVDRQAVDKALALAEEQLCPVWAMLRPGTTITHACRVADA
jgi:putative redox protein